MSDPCRRLLSGPSTAFYQSKKIWKLISVSNFHGTQKPNCTCKSIRNYYVLLDFVIFLIFLHSHHNAIWFTCFYFRVINYNHHYDHCLFSDCANNYINIDLWLQKNNLKIAENAKVDKLDLINRRIDRSTDWWSSFNYNRLDRELRVYCTLSRSNRHQINIIFENNENPRIKRLFAGVLKIIMFFYLKTVLLQRL